MKNQISKPLFSNNNRFIKFTGIAFQMLATVILGVLIGLFFDNKFETDKIFTAIFSLIFVVISLYQVLKEFIK